jgi:hypothetical protein
MEWVSDPSGEQGETHIGITQHWLRLDPPAHAWLSDQGGHGLIDERGHFHTSQCWDTCQLQPHATPWSREDLLSEIFPWGAFSSHDCELELGPDGNPLGERTWETVQGQEAARYRIEGAKGDFRVEYTLWLEALTGRLLRKEQVDRDPRTGTPLQHVIHRDYQYDVEPPPEVFNLPPPGKPLVVDEAPQHLQDVRATLPPQERREIERIIAASNHSWGRGDFDRFCRVWHFLELETAGILPDRSAWEAALRARPEHTTWASAVNSITRADGISVWSSTCILRPIAVPDVLWVTSRLQVEAADGFLWVGDAVYTVQLRPEGYRLVHWHFPSEEIREALARWAAALVAGSG